MPGKKYLTLKGRTWWFHRDIPQALRPAFGGQKTRTVNLKTSDFKVAQGRRDLAYVESVKAFRRAADGKLNEPDSLTALALTWAEEGRRYRDDPLAWARPVSLGRHIESEQDGPTFHQLLENSADTIGRSQGTEARDRFLAIAQREEPLDRHLEDHLRESGLPARALQERRTAVRRVALWRPSLTVSNLRRGQAGEFVSKALAKGDPKTGNKAISNLSRYWDWLVSRGHAAENPWKGQRLDQRRALAAEPEREFTTEEMTTLLYAPYPVARDQGQRARLHDAMRIAALSGMRIDEICRLTVADCREGLFDIRRGKTKAGKRKVPIHPDLRETVAGRMEGKEPEAFLFHDIIKRGTGERSMPVSKQFTRYRRELGVDQRDGDRRRSLVNFHSFRRWFTTMAERAGQPPHIIEAVVGHARAGMTLGTYSGGPSVEKQMRACVEAVKLPQLGK